MTRKQTLTAGIWALLMPLSVEAQAFECPAHFAEANEAIAKAEKSIQQMSGGMPLTALSHLKEARMSLVEAEYHHTKDGSQHHARAIVRADEALGHAIAAYFLSQKNSDQ